MIEAIFTGDESVMNLQIKSWQYDTGQTLCVSGLSGINADTEVHFERKLRGDAVVKTGEYDSENNTLTVGIPDVFFEYADGTPGRVWIYPRVSDDEGKTVREINIPIAERERPNDYISQDDLSRRGVIDAAVGRYIERNEHIIDDAVSEYIDEHTVITVETDNIADGAVTLQKLSSEVNSQFKTNAQADRDYSVLNTRIGNRYTKSETDALIAAAIQTAIGGVENGSY